MSDFGLHFGMAQNTGSMLVEALIFATMAFAVSVSGLGGRIAIAITGIKFLLPVVYFITFGGPYWLLIDDQAYFSVQMRLFAAGYTISSLTWFKLLTLLQLRGGTWNLLAMTMYTLFGPGYSTNVYPGIFLTFTCVPFILRALKAAGVPQNTARAYCIFFLLHIELLSQSEFFNIRDSIIMAFTTIAIASYISFLGHRRVVDLLWSVFSLIMLFFVRFYATILLALIFPVVPMLAWRVTVKNYPKYKLVLMLAVISGAVVLAAVFGLYRARFAVLSTPSIKAAAQYMLSPLIWNISDPFYSWAWAFSVFHLITMPLLGLGAYVVWRDYQQLRVLFGVLLGYILVYSLISQITGDYRLRYQIIFTYSVFQFFGFRQLIIFSIRGKWEVRHAITSAPFPEGSPSLPPLVPMGQ